MYASYASKGLEIISCPCNQFGKQEPGTPADIKEYCDKLGVKWPITEKLDVNGPNTHAIYKWLKGKKTACSGQDIQWNFAKFLVNCESGEAKFYGPREAPLSIVPDIESWL